MKAIPETLDARVQSAISLLLQIERDHSPAVFATSYGAEDMVLLDLIAKHVDGIEVFTLDTGRLPKETYQLMQTVREHYTHAVQVFYPEAKDLEPYVTEFGPDAFYASVEHRKTCCRLRKVEPLKRALSGKKAWLTGMRRSQSVTRGELSVSEWDADHQMHKFSPLAEWSHAEVWAYLTQHQVPYNALHAEGYASIGCAPCTRAITAGEDIRAGRWWWENPETKECGLHIRSQKD